MKKELLVFLDVGGTDIKVAYKSPNHPSYSSVYRFQTPKFIDLASSFKEIDPKQILALCKALFTSITKESEVKLNIYISVQMGCWLITDENNVPLSNLISWQDQRFPREYQGTFEQLLEAELGHSWEEKNGHEVRPNLAPIGIMAFLKENKLIGNPRLHGLGSWIAAALSESKSHFMHPTEAAALGMLNISTNSWLPSNKIANSLALPIIREDLQWNLRSEKSDFRIQAAVGDQQASLFGAGLTTENAIINIGTGGQVAWIGGTNEFSKFQRRPYFGSTKIDTKTHLPAGRILQAYTEELAIGEDSSSKYAWMNECGLELPFTEPVDILEIEKFSRLGQLERGNRQFAANVIHTISQKYAEVILETKLESGKHVLLFAGGIGQKMTSISKNIADHTKFDFQVSKAQETTIEGLMKLSKLDSIENII